MWKYALFAILIAIVGGGIWFYNLTGPQKLNAADRVYPGETQTDGAPVTGIAFGKADRQKLDIYKPDGKGPHPVLVFFHGGSWYHGERDGYAFLGRAFATRGFVTVIADYRKYPNVKFPAFIEDTASALAWTHKNIATHQGDPNKIFVMGHSAGAHISMLTALDPKWLKKEGLSPDILKGVIGLAGPFDFLPFEEGGSADLAMGEWPELAETQPITYARGDAPPMLLLHGKSDTLVGAHNNENLKAAIEAKGGKVTYKLYPDIDHYQIIMAVARPFRKSAPVLQDVTEFIRDNETALPQQDRPNEQPAL